MELLERISTIAEGNPAAFAVGVAVGLIALVLLFKLRWFRFVLYSALAGAVLLASLYELSRQHEVAGWGLLALSLVFAVFAFAVGRRKGRPAEAYDPEGWQEDFRDFLGKD